MLNPWARALVAAAMLAILGTGCLKPTQVDSGDSASGDSTPVVEDADHDGAPSSEDCDDNNPDLFPGAPEICDGVDNNCNGEVDEGLETSTWYADSDGDGYGDPENPLESCAQPEGYVEDNADCDDGSAYITPDTLDYPGNGDENCDGQDGQGIILAPERTGGLLNIIDADTGVGTTFEMDRDAVDIACNGDLNHDGVFECLVASPNNDEITLYSLDGTTMVEITSVMVTGGAHGVWYDPSTDEWLVALLNDGEVRAYGGTTLADQGAVCTDLREPADVYRRPGASRAIVSERGTGVVVSCNSSVVESIIMLDGTPNGILPCGDGLGCVIDRDMGVLVAFDEDSRSLVSSMALFASGPLAGLGYHPTIDQMIYADYSSAGIYTANGQNRLFLGVNPTWGVTSNVPADADGDGAYSEEFGGDDSDDRNPLVQ